MIIAALVARLDWREATHGSTEAIRVIFQAAGATKAVLTKILNAAVGTPAFHRIAEIHFPSMEALQACAASQAGRDAIAHAHKISNGGPPIVLVAEEEVVKFDGA
jgi:hypothetical protein